MSIKAIRIPYGTHAEQFGDLRLPEGRAKHPVVVIFHGGGWEAGRNLDGNGPLGAVLAERGYATWNVEYRRLGDTGGGWPMTWQDAGTAVDHVGLMARDYSLDPDRVVAMGHSAGAPMAFWTAVRQRPEIRTVMPTAPVVLVRGAVGLAGVYDLARPWPEGTWGHTLIPAIIGGTAGTLPERYAAVSPIQLLPIGVPQLVIHGTADSTTPSEESERYVAAAQAQGDTVSLLLVPGADHVAIRRPDSPVWPDVEPVILGFLEASLDRR